MHTTGSLEVVVFSSRCNLRIKQKCHCATALLMTSKTQMKCKAMDKKVQISEFYLILVIEVNCVPKSKKGRINVFSGHSREFYGTKPD